MGKVLRAGREVRKPHSSRLPPGQEGYKEIYISLLDGGRGPDGDLARPELRGRREVLYRWRRLVRRAGEWRRGRAGLDPFDLPAVAAEHIDDASGPHQMPGADGYEARFLG